ncbi:MAG: FAD-binding protein, partial [Gammaproteobacteria bacterium]
MYDVVVAGAGPAGLNAALILGRCRRRVLVCDTGQPRNARSAHLNGFLTRDGTHPAHFRQVARAQLDRYTSVETRDVAVVDAVRR